MKRLFVFSIIAILAGGAWAADTHRFGSQVIVTGDSEGRLRQVAGEPDRETSVTSRRGRASHRLEYLRKGGKSVQFTIVGGRVVSITHVDA